MLGSWNRYLEKMVPSTVIKRKNIIWANTFFFSTKNYFWISLETLVQPSVTTVNQHSSHCGWPSWQTVVLASDTDATHFPLWLMWKEYIRHLLQHLIDLSCGVKLLQNHAEIPGNVLVKLRSTLLLLFWIRYWKQSTLIQNWKFQIILKKGTTMHFIAHYLLTKV